MGLLEAISGIGMVIGGLLLSIWGGFNDRIFTTILGLIVLGVSLVFLGLTPAALFGIALVSVFAIGLAIPLIDGPLMAIFQATVRPELQGRVFTLLGSMVGVISMFSLAGATILVFDGWCFLCCDGDSIILHTHSCQHRGRRPPVDNRPDSRSTLGDFVQGVGENLADD